MIIIKYIELFLIFLTSMYIGILYSRGFSNRVRDLEEMKNAMSIFKSKIKFTYKTIPEVFEELSKEIKNNIAGIFLLSKNYMKSYTASESWKIAMQESSSTTNFNKEDIEIISNLSKTLGDTDLEGQIAIIELTEKLIDRQIQKAREEESKNGKLYKTLGMGMGITIIIILV